jgi:hypothetical protein
MGTQVINAASRFEARTSAATQPGIPLSGAQSDIWFAQRMRPETPFVVALHADLPGAVDARALAAAMTTAGRECGVAQVRIIEREGLPYLIADAGADVRTEVVDLRGEADPAASAREWMRADRQRHVDILRDPLASAAILVLGDERVLWQLRVHRILADTHGAAVLLRRAAQIYSSAADGDAAPAYRGEPAESVIESERAYEGSARWDEDADYWTAQLVGAAAPASLARRTAPGSARTYSAEAVLPSGTAARLGQAAAAYDAPAAVVVAAAFSAYLAHATGADDVTLSLPTHGRTSRALRRSAGAVANMVPLRPGIGRATSAREAVESMRDAMADALAHQQFRQRDVVRRLGFGADGFGPVINIVPAAPAIAVGRLAGTLRIASTGPVDDLVVHVAAGAPDNVRIGFETNADRYGEGETAARLGAFLVFLDEFLQAGAPHAVRGRRAHLSLVS